jgi:hypothetical protein
LRLLWKRNSAPFAACAKASPWPPNRATGKVCLKWTWPSTYLIKKDILDRIRTQFGVTVDRESLVSSLTKKVARGDRFLRPEKNTFAVRPEAR